MKHLARPDRPGRRHALRAAAGHGLALALAVAAPPLAAHGPKPHGRPADAGPPEQQAWGIAGDAKRAARTVRLRMGDDMRFSPAHLDVRLGETLRIVVRNDGRLMHEFVIGTRAELDEHAALMQRFPDMAHDEPWMAHVEPGREGAVVWHFNRAGRFHFACLIAGHHSAGMTGTITVR